MAKFTTSSALLVTGLARLPRGAETETPGCFGQGSQAMISQVLPVSSSLQLGAGGVQAARHTKLPFLDCLPQSVLQNPVGKYLSRSDARSHDHGAAGAAQSLSRERTTPHVEKKT
ncbi:hypothetical protein K456DRAFT_44387 [Colletotrichum gloeosporioides 23]|nr:hypothetical protein K456DRAFT_44387 [Colletotrichum gloeosporioides 23]